MPYSHQNVLGYKNVESFYDGREVQGDRSARAMLIFPQVVEHLTLDPNKTFATDAVKFAHMWYTRASQDMKDKFKKLVQNGQIDLCMGGWVENDESIPYFEDIIGQFYMGHNWIRHEFDISPKVGFNLLSQTHTDANAALLHDLGFQALFFTSKFLQDYQLMNRFNPEIHESHFLWFPMKESFDTSRGILGAIVNPWMKQF